MRKLIRGLLLCCVLFSHLLMAQSFVPQNGMWWNPERSGHGFDLTRYGEDIAVVWYTYGDDNQPVWYLAAGTVTGQEWTADLVKVHWDGQNSTTSSEVVGTLNLIFEDTRHTQFNWVMGARNGSELMEYLVTDTALPEYNYTGMWYDPDQPGWGATLVTQGDFGFGLLYFYDENGNPVWGVGGMDEPAEAPSSSINIPMTSFQGFCPDCPAVEGTPTNIGSMNFQSQSGTELLSQLNIQLGSGLSGSWNRENLTMNLLSDEISVEQMQEESINNVLTAFAGSSDMQQLSDFWSSIDLLNPLSTCPSVSGLGAGSGDSLSVTIDYGDGCTTATGEVVSGSLALQTSDFVTDDNTLSGQLSALFDQLVVDGDLLADGDILIDFDLSGSNNVFSGDVVWTFDHFNSAGSIVDGKVTGSIVNLDSETENPAEAFESASFVLEKFRYGSFSADGDAQLQFKTPQSGELARHITTLDFNSSEGVVQLDLLNRQTAENVWVISTQQTGFIGAASVVINNLTYQPDECEDYPVSGSVVYTYKGKSTTVTFDGSCTNPL